PKRGNAASKRQAWATARISRQHSNLSMPTKGGYPIPGSVGTLRRPNDHSVLFRQRIDSFGKPKIKLGQSAFAMRREDQTHLVVTDINVGMVLFIFRDLGHS